MTGALYPATLADPAMKREIREITSTGQWLSWRDGLLTASRISALFDSHPYITRAQLVAEMSGQSFGSNAAMRRGRVLEPAVAAAIAEDRPEWSLRKATTFHMLPDYRIGATPDYFADTEAGLLNVQCKTVNHDTWEKWRGRPPLGYLLQVACENLCADAAAGVLAVMVVTSTCPLFLFDVPRHEAAEKRILDAATEFWREWDKREPPGPASAAGLAELLEDGSHRDLSADNMLPELLDERYRLSQDTGAANRRLKTLDHEIKNRMGPARTGWLPGWYIQYPTYHRKEYTVAASDYRRLDIRKEEDNAG